MIELGDWKEHLAPLFADERYLKIRQFLIEEYRNHIVYPDMYDLYNCFRYTQFNNLKVVLLGQDPYHNEGQAHGLCFSVQDGIPNPPSLENIFKELRADVGCEKPKNGNLTKWAKEGVLLMNTSLSVRAHQANSHSKCGWAWFTDSVIKLISDKKENVVFILWGGNARSKKLLIDTSKHLVLECAHPSPLSAYNGFFGCKHFSKTNEYLKAHGIKPIDWDLTKSLPVPPQQMRESRSPFQSNRSINQASAPGNLPRIEKLNNTHVNTGETTTLPPPNPTPKKTSSLTPPKNAPIANKPNHWPTWEEMRRKR